MVPQPFEKRVKILEKHVLKNKTIVNVPRRCGGLVSFGSRALCEHNRRNWLSAQSL